MKTAPGMVEIDVLCVIDTELVKKKSLYPSQDQTNPAEIIHDCEYMRVTGAQGDARGQRTTDLSFHADVGEFQLNKNIINITGNKCKTKIFMGKGAGIRERSGYLSVVTFSFSFWLRYFLWYFCRHSMKVWISVDN